MSGNGEPYIQGWRGVLVDCNLGHPVKRGMCAALFVGIGAYALGKYRREDGRIDGRLFFWPLTVGTAVCLFT